MDNKKANRDSWENLDKAKDYHFMLRNLMSNIQTYMLLSDNAQHDAALKSLALVDGTADCVSENLICVWVVEAPEVPPCADKPPSGKNDWQQTSWDWNPQPSSGSGDTSWW